MERNRLTVPPRLPQARQQVELDVNLCRLLSQAPLVPGLSGLPPAGLSVALGQQLAVKARHAPEKPIQPIWIINVLIDLY